MHKSKWTWRLANSKGLVPEPDTRELALLVLPVIAALVCALGAALYSFIFARAQIVWSLPILLANMKMAVTGAVGLCAILEFGLIGGAMFGSRFLRLKLVSTVCVAWCIFDCLTIFSREHANFLRFYGRAPLAVGLAVLITPLIQKRIAAIALIASRPLPLGATGALIGVLLVGPDILFSRINAHQTNQPNVLIIVLDTLRADHLGAYGYRKGTSPNIDQWASQGIVFENAIATSSWTLPSHGSMLTGRLPHEHGATANWGVVNSRMPMLSEFMDGNGYRTAAFSANLTHFTRRAGFGRGFRRFDDMTSVPALFGDMGCCPPQWFYMSFFEKVPGRLGLPEVRKAAPDVTRPFLGWLARNPSQPFFAVLNMVDVHAPYLRPDLGPNAPARKLFPMGVFGDQSRKADPARIPGYRDAYDDCLRYLDAEIGKLLASLEERGTLRNSIVILTADHGEAFGEHGYFDHGNTLNLELVRVPLVIRLPESQSAGLRIQQPVSNASIPATIAELIGAEPQKQFSAPSLAPLWRSAPSDQNWPAPVSELAQITAHGGPARLGSSESVVTPEFHFIRHSKLGEQLYRWRQDPAEAHNLAADPSLAPVLADLRIQLDHALHEDKPNAF